MPRFLAFAEFGIGRHVAYAYGVLPRSYSLCRGGVPRFLVFVELGIGRHVAYAYGILPCTCSLCEGMGHGILFGYTSL